MQPDLAPVDVERRYRAVFVGLVVLVLGLAGGGWLLADGDAEGHDRAAALAAPPGPVPTSFAQADKVVEPEVAVSARRGSDDEIELCGGHWVEAGPDAKPSRKATLELGESEFEQVANDVLARMTASESPRVQAAAHYYRAGSARQLRPASRETNAEAALHRDALVALARITDDPRVYGWAWRYCHLGSGRAAPGPQGTCTQISAAQWARMDPDNAEPWLAVAHEARERQDRAALDDAMFHVAAAARYQSVSWTLAGTVAEFVPQDERSALGTYMTIHQAFRADVGSDPAWPGTADYCESGAIADANRRETCERIAAVLVDRSTTWDALGEGFGIGQRLGWSEARLHAVTAQEEAHVAATFLGKVDEFPDFTDCTPLRAYTDWARSLAEFGPVETSRRQVNAIPAEQLAAEMRRLRDMATRMAAEQAASAAAAASVPGSDTVAQR